MESNSIWKCYVDDFAHHKLHLGSDPPEGVVEAFLGTLDLSSACD